MTQDEQNDLDIARMTKKRGAAFEALDEFKKWYGKRDGVDDMIVFIGLTRDIMRGTEEEVDRLILVLEQRNQEAFFKKLSSGVDA